MAYFNIVEIKADLGITDTAEDDQINDNWGPKADNEVDDRIFTTVSKARRIIALPILPLTGTISPTIISASNHFVKKKYYQSTRNENMMNAEDKAAQQDINAFLARLNVDAVYYGRVMR